MPQTRNKQHDAWLNSLLVEGESVICSAQIHPGIYWQSIAVLLIGFLLSFFVIQWGVLIMIPGGIMLCIAAILQRQLRLVLTDKRVLGRYGLVVTQTVTLGLDRLESMEIERMLPGFLMGYADIVITGTGMRIVRIPYIANTADFRRAHDALRYGASAQKDTAKE